MDKTYVVHIARKNSLDTSISVHTLRRLLKMNIYIYIYIYIKVNFL